MSGTYKKKRIGGSLLQRRLEGKRTVFVEGIMWGGKATTASLETKGVRHMSEMGQVEQKLKLAMFNPQLLSGEFPWLISEWQIVSQFWDSIRFKDDCGSSGQFILTGSAAFADEQDDLVC